MIISDVKTIELENEAVDAKKAKQKATSGIFVVGGEIEKSDYDNTTDWSILLQDYTNMRNGDCIAGATVKSLKLPILNSQYRINTEGKSRTAKEAREYIEYSFDNLHKGFQNLKYHALLSLDYGLAMFEAIFLRGYEYEGKLTHLLLKMIPIQLETISKFLYDDNSEFYGIEHEKRVPEKATEFVELYDNELFYCSYNSEFNDIRGMSVLRPARKSFIYKQAIMDATAKAAQRGSGIPRGRLLGEVGNQKAELQNTLRSLAAGKDAYVIDHQGKFEVDLLELKNQANNMPLLEYLDRQMFFNSMSQFMTAGIGQNGSRAATSEHKASYEMAANYILAYLKSCLQELVDRMINQSPWYDLPSAEYPIIDFDAITQADMSKVAANIKTLAEAGGVEYTKTDEAYFREVFGMPEIDLDSEPVKKQVIPQQPDDTQGEGDDGQPDQSTETPPEEDGDKTKATDKKKLQLINIRKLSALEQQKHEKEIFELESANEHYLTMQERALKALNKVFVKVLKDVATQLKRNKNADLDLRYEREMSKELTLLFDEGYARGQRDFRREVNKLKPANVLDAPKNITSGTQKRIDRWIKRFYFNVKTTLEDLMDKLPIDFIENRGGMEKYILGFETGFKMDKRQILKETEAGYMLGRGFELKQFQDEIATFLYSPALDKNLCDNCAPFNGLILTYREMLDNGLDPHGKPVNLNCLGLDNCRCVVIPFELNRGSV